MTVGGLLAFLTYLSRLYGPIRGLGSTVTSAYSAAAGAERVIELLDEPSHSRPTGPAPSTLKRRRGDLAFEQVSLQLPGRRTARRCAT